MFEKKAKMSISMRPSLQEKILRLAEEEDRSVSSLIEYILAQAFLALSEEKGLIVLPNRKTTILLVSRPPKS